MKGYKFTDTEEVAHIENLELKMRVVEIKWKYIEKSTGQPVKEGKGFEKTTVRRIDGILCQWGEVEGEGEKAKKVLKEKIFHTELIVPWSYAQQGYEKANEWLEEMKILKHTRP